MSYGNWKGVSIAFLALYFVIAMSVGDVYPFFNWSLFSRIPNAQSSYTILLDAYEGVVYDPPLRFSETSFIFEKIGRSPTDYTQTIVRLGLAIERSDTDDIARYRAKLYPIFEHGRFQYRVLAVTYDPVEYWKTGVYTNARTIATFTNTP